jgi:O-acetyl-ADP-ribose deacetylase (regulator of RNase III)
MFFGSPVFIVKKKVKYAKLGTYCAITVKGEYMNIKIYLRDRNEFIIDEWEKAFEHCPDVFISCGDIFDIQADAIISPANSFGFMDGGIDGVYSLYFGLQLQESLKKKIADEFYGELTVGSAALIETGNTSIKYLLSCPTMRVPEDVSKTANAYLAFRAGLIEVIRHNKINGNKISSILCPGLGTLTGKISARNCAMQMKIAYDKILLQKINYPDNLYYACIEQFKMVNPD